MDSDLILLVREFGADFTIRRREYLDGVKLTAYPRQARDGDLVIARTTREELAEALREILAREASRG